MEEDVNKILNELFFIIQKGYPETNKFEVYAQMINYVLTYVDNDGKI